MALTHSLDLRFALRSVLGGGIVAVVAVLSLALGIAANATIFSLVQAVEFPTLIYPDADRIVFLESRNHARGISGMLISLPDAADVEAAARTFEIAAVAADQSSVLRHGSVVRRVTGRRVEAAFFDVLGVPAALGRRLVHDDREGVLVLSDALWRSVFAADPSVIGRTVRFDGGLVVIAGIMPPHFDTDADFWTPFAPPTGTRDDRRFSLFAKLASTAGEEDARRELQALSTRLAEAHPATNANWEMYPVPLARLHGRDSRDSFLLLQAAVGFLLLIACANIANILLARATNRRHEMAVRLALGASRGRLARLLLGESLLLSLAGAALGVLLAAGGIRIARAIGGFPDVLNPHLNLWVLGFAGALVVVTTVVCGLLPALQASSAAPGGALQGETRTLDGSTRSAFRSGLVVLQIAVAVVLVTGGALMVRTLVNRMQVDLGFDPRGALRADVNLPYDRYADPLARRSAVDRILTLLREDASVSAAGAATWALPTSAGGMRPVTVPGREDRPLPTSVRRSFEAVTPGYLDALGVPLRAGRDFTAADGAGAAAVAIVNEELVRQFFAGENPVGQALRLGASTDIAPLVTIVGVVGNVRRSPMHTPMATIYVPYAQHSNGPPTFVIRSRDRIDTAMRGFEAVVHRVDAELLAENVRTMSEDVARYVAPIRLVTLLLAVFAAFALLLAALGVFGAMSYTVSLRRRELAVRAALGASGRDLLRLVFRQALVVTLAGVTIGLAATAFATRAIAGMVFGVNRFDPVTLTGVVMLLAAVALLACYRPARAAAGADPMLLLRP
jgi:putative ABC transport system permease protein